MNKEIEKRGSWFKPELFDKFVSKILKPLQKKYLKAVEDDQLQKQEQIKMIIAGLSDDGNNWKSVGDMIPSMNFSESIKHREGSQDVIDAFTKQDAFDIEHDKNTNSMVMLFPYQPEDSSETPLTKTVEGESLMTTEQEPLTMRVTSNDIANIIEKNTPANELALTFATSKLEYFEQGKNNIPFDFNGAVSFVKQELKNASRWPAAYDDVLKNNSSFYKDMKEGFMLDISYAEVGINPIGLDLNGDGVINENEFATFTEVDKDKTFKKYIDSDEFPDGYSRWVAKHFEQNHAKGRETNQTILDKEAKEASATGFDPNSFKRLNKI